MELTVETNADAERHLATVRQAADRTQRWIAAHAADSMDLLRSLKFESVGFHPIADRALNVIEQVNQTFTYAVALAAARELLLLHHNAGGFVLAPDAHMSRPLDIMSRVDGLVGAETFAAVHPRNNQKLVGDLDKLAARTERHRYVFFASPAFPGARRLIQLERDGGQVWSVEVQRSASPLHSHFQFLTARQGLRLRREGRSVAELPSNPFLIASIYNGFAAWYF